MRVVNPDWIAAFAGVVQAGGVVPALTFGAMALRGDRNDRRVDRVLALHEELVGGSLDGARRQVARQVKPNATSPATPIGGKNPDGSPDECVSRLFRFFERVEAIRLAGSADMPLLTELIGRHAAWFDIAVTYNETSKVRRATHALAIAVNDFAATKGRSTRYRYLADWGVSRRRDFSEEVLEEYRRLCLRTSGSAGRWEWLRPGPSKRVVGGESAESEKG